MHVSTLNLVCQRRHCPTLSSGSFRGSTTLALYCMWWYIVIKGWFLIVAVLLWYLRVWVSCCDCQLWINFMTHDNISWWRGYYWTEWCHFPHKWCLFCFLIAFFVTLHLEYIVILSGTDHCLSCLKAKYDFYDKGRLLLEYVCKVSRSVDQNTPDWFAFSDLWSEAVCPA